MALYEVLGTLYMAIWPYIWVLGTLYMAIWPCIWTMDPVPRYPVYWVPPCFLYPRDPIFRYPVPFTQWLRVRTRVRTRSTHHVPGGTREALPTRRYQGGTLEALPGPVYGHMALYMRIWPCIWPYGPI